MAPLAERSLVNAQAGMCTVQYPTQVLAVCQAVLSQARVLKWRPLVEEKIIRIAIDRHWAASAAGDLAAEHEIYHDDAVCEYPQSGEVIRGRGNLRALREHHPGRPSGFAVRRIVGKGSLWVTEYVITYGSHPVHTVSIMEFRDRKVSHETQYFADPFEAPAWRAQWVERST